MIKNVNVSGRLPCEKSSEEQLEIMEAYTKAHADSAGLDKSERELNCLKVIYPTMFSHIENQDQIAGRLDFLPIGFGSVTSIGGVGHYCVFYELRAFGRKLEKTADKERVRKLYDYWQYHDVKSIDCQDVLNDTTAGRFIDCRYPFRATARLSGMMLDYQKLMCLGVKGLIQLLEQQPQNPFIRSCIGTMHLFEDIIRRQIELVQDAMNGADETRRKDLPGLKR